MYLYEVDKKLGDCIGDNFKDVWYVVKFWLFFRFFGLLCLDVLLGCSVSNGNVRLMSKLCLFVCCVCGGMFVCWWVGVIVLMIWCRIFWSVFGRSLIVGNVVVICGFGCLLLCIICMLISVVSWCWLWWIWSRW